MELPIPETELSKRMRELAKTRTDLPIGWLNLADAFDRHACGFYSTPQTSNVQAFLGSYARARKAWCEATGEPLA